VRLTLMFLWALIALALTSRNRQPLNLAAGYLVEL
jgi:hypothetical protein